MNCEQKLEYRPTNATYWKNQTKMKDAEIERLNAQIAMQHEALAAFSGLTAEAYKMPSVDKWLASHDFKIRNDALDDVARMFESADWSQPYAAKTVRNMKGDD